MLESIVHKIVVRLASVLYYVPNTFRKLSYYIRQPIAMRSLGIILFLVGLGVLSSPYWSVNNKDVYSFDYLPSGEERVVVEEEVEPAIQPDQLANWLTIPVMGVDSAISEGGLEVLKQGVWHLPRTSTPDQGGNTVLAAHRWLYRPPDPRTFYLLDKLKVGDEIYVNWENKEYKYVVVSIKVVKPDQVEVLASSDKPILTLFSCTPLYSTSHRLVVVAELVHPVK